MATCPNANEQECKLQLSNDGVSESLSTSISLDVFSIKFEKCRKVYPVRIVRPLKKASIDQKMQLFHVLNDLTRNNCKVTHFIGDNPKRANAKGCLCFSSWYPCEYCFSKGTKITKNVIEQKKSREKIDLQNSLIEEKLESLKESGSASATQINKLKKMQKENNEAKRKLTPKKSNIVWPKSSSDAPLRTRNAISDIVEQIENNQPMSKDEAKGVVERSLLFDLPHFDYVMDTPVEYLHCLCLGCIKRCVELTFKIGENRPRITKRKLSSPSAFNLLILTILVPREFNRRVRELDFALYKGQEYRNLLLFFFPLVLSCIEANAKERHMWLYLTYMVKACVVPTEEFRNIPLDVISECARLFYSIYEALFGVLNCTYNTHVVGSHILQIRYHGPLTLTSAFPFESFYGELRQSFVLGTISPLKQVFRNVLIKRILGNHNCEQEIFISTENTAMECNNLVYCYEQNKYKLYKVIEIRDEEFVCEKINVSKCTFPETPSLNWDLVGVFKKVENSENENAISTEIIPHNSIKGKVVSVLDFLITCPSNVLREK